MGVASHSSLHTLFLTPLLEIHMGRFLLGSIVSGWMGWLGFFCVLLGKNCFWLVWLINLYNQPQTGIKWLKKHLLDYVA